MIIATTVLALGLRLYQLTRPGYLLGVTEYDDGTDFGSGVLLAHGYLPYRDFIIVQPPGITLLMAPVALVTKGIGTAWGMAVARILTAIAGGAAVALAGLLVRHRGLLAVLLTCGILAVYPASVQSAHTVLLEPWLVLFCLAGALAVFDGDQIAGGWRLAWGGAAFGFAGAIKVWAVLPVVVILVLCACRPRRAPGLAGLRRAGRYGAGVAVGFLVPVLPFAVLAPRTFYDSVVVAQLVRIDVMRVPLAYRLHEMTGLTDVPSIALSVLVLVSLALLVVVIGSSVLAARLTHRAPARLDWFAFGTSALVVAAFLWPADFYYHYAGFLAPFLALAIALPVSRLVAASGPADRQAVPLPEPAGPARPDRPGTAGRRRSARHLGRYAVAIAGVAILAMAATQAGFESTLQPPLAPPTPGIPGNDIAVVQRLIPPGSCVLADQVSYVLAADRFISSVPGCSLIVDGVGTDYSLSLGRNAVTGAENFPAVRAVWLAAFRSAQYVWLSALSYKRIPWGAPEVVSYFDRNFVPVLGGPFGLYVRKGLHPR